MRAREAKGETALPASPSLPPETPRRRFTAEEYHKMAEVGILHEDDRVELIGGEVIETTAIGTRHLACVVALTHLLAAVSGSRYFVSVQNPVRLGEIYEPQPDLSLLGSRPDPNAEAPPGLEDVLLLIEVSDTTLHYDKDVKLPLYAAAGIPETWVVDLQNGIVEVHTAPAGPSYTKVRRYGRDERLVSEVLPDLALPVREMLG